MKWLALVLSYLPVILTTVKSVEEIAQGVPGQSKKDMVLNIISAGAKGAEQIPEAHISGIGTLIDVVVGQLNQSGVFKKG